MVDPSGSGVAPDMTRPIGVHDATQRVRENRLIASCRRLSGRPIGSARMVGIATFSPRLVARGPEIRLLDLLQDPAEVTVPPRSAASAPRPWARRRCRRT